MRTLNFSVHNQCLSKQGDFSNIVSGSQGYLKCTFSFCSEWDGLLKVAEFRVYESDDPILEKIISNSCMVPAEVTKKKQWYVNVIGKKGEKKITTNKERIKQEV